MASTFDPQIIRVEPITHRQISDNSLSGSNEIVSVDEEHPTITTINSESSSEESSEENPTNPTNTNNNHHYHMYQRQTRFQIYILFTSSIMIVFIAFAFADIFILMLDMYDSCNKPISRWIIINLCIRFMLYVSLLLKDRIINSSNLVVSISLDKIIHLLFAFRFSWVVYGTWILVDGDENCSILDPQKYELLLAHILSAWLTPLLIPWLMILTCIVKYFRNAGMDAIVEDMGWVAGISGASQRQIEKLPKYTFELIGDIHKIKPENQSGNNSEIIIEKDKAMCAICIDDYENGDKLKLMDCKHHYHAICIDRWLARRAVCPMCKNNI